MIPMTDPTPELDKYELLEELGHGGMATVYRAKDRRLGRNVAVKIIHRHLRQNAEVARRFTSEARAVAKLKHINIVEVYDVSGEEETERYLVVELVDGLTLRQLLTEDERLPVEVGVCLALEVARAVEHAHREGVIHRDIKPENVLLECKRLPSDEDKPYSLKIKLTDFGIAKVLDAQGVTSTGQVLGSPAHMLRSAALAAATIRRSSPVDSQTQRDPSLRPPYRWLGSARAIPLRFARSTFRCLSVWPHRGFHRSFSCPSSHRTG